MVSSRASQIANSIDLSQVKCNSTCISLNIPSSLECSECANELDPLIRTRKKRKSQRQKCDRRKCRQYWDTKWTQGKDATEGNILKHKKVRAYLQINQDITIDYKCIYKKDEYVMCCIEIPSRF